MSSRILFNVSKEWADNEELLAKRVCSILIGEHGRPEFDSLSNCWSIDTRGNNYWLRRIGYLNGHNTIVTYELHARYRVFPNDQAFKEFFVWLLKCEHLNLA